MMRKIRVVVIAGCIGVTAFAGDTNFVAAFDTIWQTHNATNILVFVEQNVATNASPEVLFARGTIAIVLQDWIPGATNYWEQAIHMISTNSAYSEKGKTNAVNQLRAFQGSFAGLDTNPPSWLTETHAHVFTRMGHDVPFLPILQKISTIPPAETP